MVNPDNMMKVFLKYKIPGRKEVCLKVMYQCALGTVAERSMR